jgi:hypothetical protein
MEEPASIEYKEKIISESYHGTNIEGAESIVQEGFELSRGDHQFLGLGVYFFKKSQWHAEDWARRQRNFDTVAILQAMVEIGKCLDLDRPKHRSLVEKTYRKLEQEGYGEATDAVVINFLASEICEIDTVMATYVQPDYERVYTGSRFYDYVQNLLCVRNRGNILEYEVVHTEL